jgi:hypothetical protein
MFNKKIWGAIGYWVAYIAIYILLPIGYVTTAVLGGLYHNVFLIILCGVFFVTHIVAMSFFLNTNGGVGFPIWD